jgi:hypothetical protein
MYVDLKMGQHSFQRYPNLSAVNIVFPGSNPGKVLLDLWQTKRQRGRRLVEPIASMGSVVKIDCFLMLGFKPCPCSWLAVTIPSNLNTVAIGLWAQTAATTSRASLDGIETLSEFCVRFEVFTAVTVKNDVFWDIKTQFVLHRRHITSLLQSPAS